MFGDAGVCVCAWCVCARGVCVALRVPRVPCVCLACRACASPAVRVSPQVECPVPEQFVTKINNDNTTSTHVSEIYG